MATPWRLALAGAIALTLTAVAASVSADPPIGGEGLGAGGEIVGGEQPSSGASESGPPQDPSPKATATPTPTPPPPDPKPSDPPSSQQQPPPSPPQQPPPSPPQQPQAPALPAPPVTDIGPPASNPPADTPSNASGPSTSGSKPGEPEATGRDAGAQPEDELDASVAAAGSTGGGQGVAQQNGATPLPWVAGIFGAGAFVFVALILLLFHGPVGLLRLLNEILNAPREFWPSRGRNGAPPTLPPDQNDFGD
jgi:outer membrane biosynthesis protein TonB